MPKDVVIICTRNRIDALEESLRSLATQNSDLEIVCYVVDSSDLDRAGRIRELCTKHPNLDCSYHSYPGAPSLARQRDFGIDLVGNDADLVHFIDDDVTLDPDYLSEIRKSFSSDAEVLGVGASITKEQPSTRSSFYRLFNYFFLLEHPRIGGVLPSGGESVAQNFDLEKEVEVDCLGGCACYRIDIIEELRPDARLEGYSLDEDLDWSYRIGRRGKLLVQPKARFVHHEAPQERHQAAKMAKERLIHRYWFLEKNIESSIRKPAFWWSVSGLILRTFISSSPVEKEKRKGILEGIKIVRDRDHPLLVR